MTIRTITENELRSERPRQFVPVAVIRCSRDDLAAAGVVLTSEWWDGLGIIASALAELETGEQVQFAWSLHIEENPEHFGGVSPLTVQATVETVAAVGPQTLTAHVLAALGLPAEACEWQVDPAVYAEATA